MCCPRAWPSRVSSTQRRKPSAGVNAAPSAPVTARSCNPEDTAAMYSRQSSISDDDLPDGQEFLLRRRAFVAPPLGDGGRTDTARERDEAGGKVETRGQAAQREVCVAAANRVDDADAQAGQGKDLMRFPDHRAVLAVGDRQRSCV